MEILFLLLGIWVAPEGEIKTVRHLGTFASHQACMDERKRALTMQPPKEIKLGCMRTDKIKGLLL